MIKNFREVKRDSILFNVPAEHIRTITHQSLLCGFNLRGYKKNTRLFLYVGFMLAVIFSSQKSEMIVERLTVNEPLLLAFIMDDLCSLDFMIVITI